MMIAECNRCGAPNLEPNFRCCPSCRALFRKYKSPSHVGKTSDDMKAEIKTLRLQNTQLVKRLENALARIAVLNNKAGA